HPAEGGDDRERRLPGRGQLAHAQLALDLEPDEQEEDDHEAVVDPVVQRTLDRGGGRSEDEFRFPEMGVRLTPWGVGPEECDGGGGKKEQAAQDAGGGEFLERLKGPSDAEAGSDRSEWMAVGLRHRVPR